MEIPFLVECPETGELMETTVEEYVTHLSDWLHRQIADAYARCDASRLAVLEDVQRELGLA